MNQNKTTPPVESAPAMTSMLEIYRALIGVNAAAKVISFVVSYCTVILLNKILAKDAYGELMFFVSIFGYVAILGSLGFDKLLLFRLSQYNEKADSEFFGKALFARLCAISVAWTVLVEAFLLLFWWLAEPVDYSYDRVILLMLSVNTLVGAPLVLAAACLEANKRSTAVIVAGVAVLLLRFAILLAIYALPSSEVRHLAYYFILPTILHLLWYLYYMGRISEGAVETGEVKGGYRYSLNMMMTKFSHIGIENLNVLVIGVLLASASVAEYSVAAKVAMLVTLGNELLAPLVGPRLKYQMERGSVVSVTREYAFARKVSTFVGLVVIAALVMVGPWVLQLFGDYRGSFQVMLILSLAFFNQVAFGPNGRYLALKGHSGFLLATSLGALMVSIVASIAAVTAFGLMGAAWTNLAILLLLNCVLMYAIYKLEGLVFLGVADWLLIIGVNLAVISLVTSQTV